MTVHDIAPLGDSPELVELRERIATSLKRSRVNARIKKIGDRLTASREDSARLIKEAEDAGVFARVSE